MKRKNPDTSVAAYHSLDPAKIRKTYQDIMKALESLGKGNYEQISDWLNVDPAKIWKRTSEMVRLGLIHRTESKILTRSKKFSYQYALGPSPEPVKRKERVMKGKTVSDFSKALIQPKQSSRTQESLF